MIHARTNQWLSYKKKVKHPTLEGFVAWLKEKKNG